MGDGQPGRAGPSPTTAMEVLRAGHSIGEVMHAIVLIGNDDALA